MLDDLGLIHMNGRIYDPLLGRFLSADTLVQAPGNLQSYNRYSYVLNNPLSYSDPSGYWFESAWDAFSLTVGVASFISNVREGNVGSAILDGVGIVADATALVLPIVPGGVGVGIKALRGTAAVAGKIDDVVNGVQAVQSTASVVSDVASGDVSLDTALEATQAAATALAGVKAKVDTPNTRQLDANGVTPGRADGAVNTRDAPTAQTSGKTSGDGSETTSTGPKKRGPKPKAEGGPHNETIAAEGQKLESGQTLEAGGGTKPEKLIATPGGHKSGRRPDVLKKDKNGNLSAVQVGKTKADGTPIMREQEALEDLNNAGIPTTFVPYDR